MSKKVTFEIDMDDYRSREVNADKMVTFRLPESDFNALKDRHPNVSYLLRQIVRDFLAATEPTKKKASGWTR